MSVENVHSFVLGGHGDTMVPLPRYSTVAGIPIDRAAVERAHRRASPSGPPTAAPRSRSWSAPAPGTRPVRPRPRCARRSSRTRRRSCRARCSCRASTGFDDLFVGVPVKLGARGVEQIIQIKLTAEEDAALKKSAAAVKELVDVIGM